MKTLSKVDQYQIAKERYLAKGDKPAAAIMALAAIAEADHEVDLDALSWDTALEMDLNEHERHIMYGWISSRPDLDQDAFWRAVQTLEEASHV